MMPSGYACAYFLVSFSLANKFGRSMTSQAQREHAHTGALPPHCVRKRDESAEKRARATTPPSLVLSQTTLLNMTGSLVTDELALLVQRKRALFCSERAKAVRRVYVGGRRARHSHLTEAPASIKRECLTLFSSSCHTRAAMHGPLVVGDGMSAAAFRCTVLYSAGKLNLIVSRLLTRTGTLLWYVKRD